MIFLYWFLLVAAQFLMFTTFAFQHMEAQNQKKSHEDYDEKKGAKMMKSSLYEKKKELMLITNGEDDIYISDRIDG